MNEYANKIKCNLETAIREVKENSKLFLKNPKKDFTRKRKLDFEEMMKIIFLVSCKT